MVSKIELPTTELVVNILNVEVARTSKEISEYKEVQKLKEKLNRRLEDALRNKE